MVLEPGTQLVVGQFAGVQDVVALLGKVLGEALVDLGDLRDVSEA